MLCRRSTRITLHGESQAKNMPSEFKLTQFFSNPTSNQNQHAVPDWVGFRVTDWVFPFGVFPFGFSHMGFSHLGFPIWGIPMLGFPIWGILIWVFTLMFSHLGFFHLGFPIEVFPFFLGFSIWVFLPYLEHFFTLPFHPAIGAKCY